MSARATLTVEVSPEVKDRLERIAADTRRSSSMLASLAVTSFVERETAILAGIDAGLADAGAGRLLPHDEAMAELEAVLDASKVKKGITG